MSDKRTDDTLRAALRRVAVRMVRLEGGCEQSHRVGSWHMHEEPYHRTGRELAALAASAPDEYCGAILNCAKPSGHAEEEHERADGVTWRWPVASAPDEGPTFADALVKWYDTTHGNEFGHDHHCPVRDDQPPDDRCTCGWADVQRAEATR